MATKWEIEAFIAEKAGWVTIFNPGRVFGWNYYKKDNEAIWQKDKNTYVRAKLIGTVFFAHQYFSSLEDALLNQNEFLKSA